MHPHRSYAKVPQEWICRKITPDSLQTGVPRRAPLSAHRGRVRPARCSDNASSARRSSKSSDSGLANSSAHCRSDSNSANRKRANLSCSAWGVRQLYRMPLEAVVHPVSPLTESLCTLSPHVIHHAQLSCRSVVSWSNHSSQRFMRKAAERFRGNRRSFLLIRPDFTSGTGLARKHPGCSKLLIRCSILPKGLIFARNCSPAACGRGLRPVCAEPAERQLARVR